MPSRLSRQILRFIAFAALILSITFSAGAQRYLGGIQGEVADASGAKVAGATVTAEETSTHFKTIGISNGAGAYNFPALNPGTYKVSVTASSFKTENREDVVLTAGQVQVIDFSLTAGAVSETVDVTASNTLLDAGSANIATTLSTQEVTDLPNVGRNPFVLATLAAGVTTGAYMQSKSSQFTQPFSGVSVQIIGDGSSGHNRLTLDGIPDDPAERFSGASYTGFVPSPEAVQEVKVQTSIFDAQIGHGNGTVTNTVIRSGNNKIHGAPAPTSTPSRIPTLPSWETSSGRSSFRSLPLVPTISVSSSADGSSTASCARRTETSSPLPGRSTSSEAPARLVPPTRVTSTPATKTPAASPSSPPPRPRPAIACRPSPPTVSVSRTRHRTTATSSTSGREFTL